MRARVEHHAQPGACWVLATRATAPAVRACVPLYVGYEERTTGPLKRLEVPHPNVTIIINLGAPLKLHAPAFQASGDTFGGFAAGVFDTVVVTESALRACQTGGRHDYARAHRGELRWEWVRSA